MDRIFKFLVIVSVAFLAFIGGAFVILTQVFPSGYLSDAYEAMVALYHQQEDYKSPYVTNLWRPARTDERGVTVYNQAKTYDGFTLYTSAHAQKAFLISMDGEVVHEWALPISKIWENSRWDQSKRKLRPPGFVTWEDAYLYPNGDLLAMYVGTGDTPWGYGLVKMDKNSKVIWKHFDYTHHALDVADDGKIYVLTNTIENTPIEGYENLAPPRLDDYVNVLSPDGKLLNKVSIMDAMLRSPYARMLHTTAWNVKEDYLHSNSVQFIDRKTASKLPFASEGQVLLSFRDIDTIAILDLDKKEIVWALEGSWHRQHSARMLPNGHVLLFDNWGHYRPGGASRVIEFNPVTSEMVWAYAGNEKRFFESRIRSDQKRLPNGNTLITESDGGRIIEVARSGEIVWEYVNPVRAGDKNALIPVLYFGVRRIAPTSLDPEFRQILNEPPRSPKSAARTTNLL
jgi:hypothetical protein